MRPHSMTLLALGALLVTGCAEEEDRIDFSPEAFLVSTLTLAAGAPVSFTVTGSFSMAEIYQGDARVSTLSIPARVASFLAVSDAPLKAVVWGNDASEKKELSPVVTPELNPCGVVDVYEAEFPFHATGNAAGVSCEFEPAAPLQTRVEVLGGAQSAIFGGELLVKQPRTPFGDPDPDNGLCTFSWGSSYGSDVGLPRWVLLKAYEDRVDLYLEKQGDTRGTPGCVTRWMKSYPRP